MEDFRHRNAADRMAWAFVIGGVLASLCLTRASVGADDAAPDNGGKKPTVIARRVVLRGAATPLLEREIKSTMQELQREAAEKNATAVLVVEVHRGPSSFGQVLGIAKLLASPEFARVRTVAWIPKGESVSGNNAVVALSCSDIVMHPDASLGDVGSGKAADEEVQAFVQKRLIESQHNPRLNGALARGLLDPQVAVKKVTVVITKDDRKVRETRIVTDEDLAKLRATKAETPDKPTTIKDAGEVGLLTGSKALADGILVAGTRQTLEELAAMYAVPVSQLRDSATVSGKRKNVALIRISRSINSVTQTFLERQIERCEQEGIDLIIFEITSPGGDIKPGMVLAQRITGLPERIKTVAYVPSQALNSAAIIALSCDEIYVGPDAVIGSIGPIGEEHVNEARTTLRTLADKKHRSPALVEAMARTDLVVYRATHTKSNAVAYMTDDEIKSSDGKWVAGRAVPETLKGELLTLTGERTVELQLAVGTVVGDNDTDRLRSLKAQLGLSPDMKLTALESTWVDTLVFWLNTGWVTVLLVMLGIVFIYMELHFMNGMCGILATLCFAMFFWSRVFGGTAGWLEVILFVIGLGCIALEIFVIPGFGVFGISGGLLVISSLVLASQTFGNLEPSADLDQLSRSMGKLALSVVLVVATAMLISRYLPHVPLFNKMALAPPGHVDDHVGLGPQLHPEHTGLHGMLLGQTGVTLSVLRPAGKATIGNKVYDVVSDGPYINDNSRVEVVSVSGNRIVVRNV